MSSKNRRPNRRRSPAPRPKPTTTQPATKSATSEAEEVTPDQVTPGDEPGTPEGPPEATESTDPATMSPGAEPAALPEPAAQGTADRESDSEPATSTADVAEMPVEKPVEKARPKATSANRRRRAQSPASARTSPKAKPRPAEPPVGADEAPSGNGSMRDEAAPADEPASPEGQPEATEDADATASSPADEPVATEDTADDEAAKVKPAEQAVGPRPGRKGASRRPAKAAAPKPAQAKRKPLPAAALVGAHDETVEMPARSGTNGEAADKAQAPRKRQLGIKAALDTLPVPEAGPTFWVDLETALADQQPLAIAARPAIRPITEPPPLSQPKLSDYIDATHARPAEGEGVKVTSSRLGDEVTGAKGGRSGVDFGLGGGRSGRGRTLGVIAVVVVLGLLIIGTIMGDADDEPPTSTGDEAPSTTTPPDDTTPTTTPAVPGLEPDARLTAIGIGPLQVGRTLAQVTQAGVTANVDQPTFDASGGTCFDARPAGAGDLTLRFRSPQSGTPVADPAAGVLGAISIRDVDGSLRATSADVGLGATEEVVLAAHAGALEVTDNPSRPGGHVYLARSPDNPNLGIAYSTDGRQVTDISVGEATLLNPAQPCA